MSGQLALPTPTGALASERSPLPPTTFLVATFLLGLLAATGGSWAWTAGRRGLAAAALLGGLSFGPCLAAYASAPRAWKPLLRRLVLITGGLSIVAPGFVDGTSLELEGFFALVLIGSGGAAIGHTLVTAILGPLVFGRALCGWGCWRAMVLELLPVGRAAGRPPWMLLTAQRTVAARTLLPFAARPPRRRRAALALLPYAGLALSVAAGSLVAASGHAPTLAPHPAGPAFAIAVASCGVYYALSIGMAVLMRDQRAFCKHLCPTGAILRLSSRPSLLRIVADAARCDECGACSRACPMDVEVAQAARTLGRVPGGRCILCQGCVAACPRSALRLSFGYQRTYKRGTRALIAVRIS